MPKFLGLVLKIRTLYWNDLKFQWIILLELLEKISPHYKCREFSKKFYSAVAVFGQKWHS